MHNLSLVVSIATCLSGFGQDASAEEEPSLSKPGGIGTMIEVDGDAVKIVSILENGAAQKARLREGGVITSVNSTSVTGMEVSEVTKLLIGRTGTKVRVGYTSPGETGSQELEITREPIDLPPHLLLVHGFVDLLIQKAESGDIDSQVVLGEALIEGYDSLEKDSE